MTQQARKFRKVQAKEFVKSNKSNFFREIAFLLVLNFFPVEKLIFGYFEIAKNGICSNKFFVEIDLFDFTSFFGLDFFKFSGPL